jgi:hypothetical protein
MTLSDNQTAAKKMLAILRTQDDHHRATGRRFKS